LQVKIDSACNATYLAAAQGYAGDRCPEGAALSHTTGIGDIPAAQPSTLKPATAVKAAKVSQSAQGYQRPGLFFYPF
jgi:hypothetical protein